MKKLFTLLGAGLLLGMSTASANTVTFDIYSSEGEDMAQYVSILNMETGMPIQITNNSASEVFTSDVNYQISSTDPSEYKIVISISGQDYNTFNSFAGDDASLNPNSSETVWDLFLTPVEKVGDPTFTISLISTGSGSGSGNEYTTVLNFYPDDNMDIEEGIYEYVTTTASYGSIYVDDDVYPYNFTTPISLYFTPINGYMISDIMIYDETGDITDSSNCVRPATENGEWTVNYNNLPEETYVYIFVGPYEGSGSTQPGGGVEKTISLFVNDFDDVPATVNGYIGSQKFTLGAAFTEFTYYDATTVTLYSGDNEYELEVVCSDFDYEKGEDYEMIEDDGVWIITLTNNTPSTIMFNISVVEEGTGNTPEPGPGEENTTVYFNVDGLNGLENAYEHISVTYFGINMTPTDGNVNLTSGSTQFICTPYISFQVTPEAGYEITEIYTASEYASASEPAEGKTTWDLSVNPGSTSNIFFNINVSQIGAVPPPVTKEPNVTLNFLGEGVVKGLTVTYTDIDAPVNNGIYSPTKTPFEFPVSSKNSSFTVAAAGYNIAISGASSNGNYYTISGNTVSMTEHTSDLTFNVTVTPADVETYSATFNFVKGAEELIKVLNPAEDDAEVEFSGASYVFDYTGTAGLVFAVEEENYAITVECTNYTGTNAPYSVEYYGTDGLKPQATVTLTPEADGLVFNVSVIEVEAPATESSVTINFTGIANAQNYVVVREMVEEEVIDVVSNSYTYAFTDFGGLLFTANEGYTLEVACTNYKGDADDAPFSITGINPLVESDEPGITSVMLTVTSEADGLIFEVTVSQDTTTGIAGIEADANGNYNVYGINGVNVMNTNNAGELKNLNKGLYIINGKKVSIRK